ncbi:MAG: hypothetical protein ACYCOU_02930 [Sulfobacillus sp.]
MRCKLESLGDYPRAITSVGLLVFPDKKYRMRRWVVGGNPICDILDPEYTVYRCRVSSPAGNDLKMTEDEVDEFLKDKMSQGMVLVEMQDERILGKKLRRQNPTLGILDQGPFLLVFPDKLYCLRRLEFAREVVGEYMVYRDEDGRVVVESESQGTKILSIEEAADFLEKRHEEGMIEVNYDYMGYDSEPDYDSDSDSDFDHEADSDEA